MAIHDKIREYREQKRYSQEYMSSQLGISQNAYSRIELGQTKIELNRLLKIAELLETSLSSLIGEDHQVFNIHQNQTVNGNVTNQGLPEKEQQLFEKIITGKDERIKQLEEEIKFLRSIVKG